MADRGELDVLVLECLVERTVAFANRNVQLSCWLSNNSLPDAKLLFPVREIG